MSLEEFENFTCPYCGENNTLPIDYSGGSSQRFVVDCEVCCAPIIVRLQIKDGQIISLQADREND